MLTALQDLQSASTSGGDVTGALDTFREAIATTDESSRQFLRALEISGDPMAKFVIKLANLNESIDDTTFKQMAEIRKNIKPEELGEAQNKLRMGIDKIRAAFDKLLISVLSPEVINGFGATIDSLALMIQSLADWIKTTGFGMLQNAMNTLVGFFSGGGTALSGMFDGLTNRISGAIGSGIARGVAIAVAGGTNEEDLANYDKMVAGFRGAGSEAERKNLIKQAYKSMGGREKVHPSEIDPKASLGFAKPVSVTDEYMRNFLEKQMGGYFAGDIFSGGGESSQNNSPGYPGSKTSNATSLYSPGSTPSRSKIRIMPMYGDPKSMVEKTPAQETNELLKKQIEVLEEQVRILSQNSAEQKKSTTELSKIASNNQMSLT